LLEIEEKEEICIHFVLAAKELWVYFEKEIKKSKIDLDKFEIPKLEKRAIQETLELTNKE
jgi:hypothetical protein